MTRIVLAEDHGLVRKGIKALLEREKSFSVVGEAAELTEKLKPDVLLLDLSLPRLSGIAVIRRLVPSLKTSIVVLTMHADGINVREALASGAMGYVLKNSTPEELVLSIRTVTNGDPFITAALRREALGAVLKTRSSTPEDPCEGLTARERMILEHASTGMTNAQIAEKLFISSRTVESHRANLMKKLQLANQTDLVRFAVRQKILTP